MSSRLTASIVQRQALLSAPSRLHRNYASTSQERAATSPSIASAPSQGAPERINTTGTSTSSFSNTHFGFRNVPEEEKIGLVGGVFSSVANSYDVMNDAMSLGVHRLWKDNFVKRLDPRGGINCLDVAGGTGDIAKRILDHARIQHGDRDCKVTILDINVKMLRAGQKRMRQTMYWGGPQLSFQLGNAENLTTSTPPAFGSSPQQTEATGTNLKLPSNTSPLPALPTIPIPDNSLDLYTIAFGIRNCTHIDQVLSEAYRVLKPGGIFACLEFGKVTVPLLAQ